MDELTKKQSNVMDFLLSYAREHGYPPTIREIGKHLGVTWQAARGHLKAIAKKGVISLVPGKSRGIEIPGLRPGWAMEVPVAGRVRAGEPALAVEEFDESIVVDKRLFRDANTFVLKIRGESMVEAGIYDGDYAVVRPQAEIRNNEVAVVLIGGEDATVKKVRIRENSITLIPCNSTMSPKLYGLDEVSVVGKVMGIIRKF